MKSRIFSYLFIFTALFVLFQYVNTRRYVTATEAKIKILKTEKDRFEKALDSLATAPESGYFSLAGNEEALSYFDSLNINDLPHYIEDKLLETNEDKGDNPLVPYAGTHGPMKINKIKLLNHKWLIADFSDGKQWGELFIAYEFTPDLHVTFTVLRHLLYSGT